MQKGKACTCVCARHNRCPWQVDAAPPKPSAEGGVEALRTAHCVNLCLWHQAVLS